MATTMPRPKKTGAAAAKGQATTKAKANAKPAAGKPVAGKKGAAKPAAGAKGGAKPAASAKAAAKPAARKTAPPKKALDQITPHFRVAEFNCHDGTPVPSAAHPALKRLCEKYLEPMRKRFGAATVLSGFRHRRYNDRIGGAKKSMHVYEEHPDQVAADLRFATGTPAEWAAFAAKIGAPGVGRYDDSRFVHVDNRKSGPARWSGFQG